MIIDSHAHVVLPSEKQLLLMEQAGVAKTILFSTTPHPEKANNLVEFEEEISLLNKVLSGSCTGEERLNGLQNTINELCAAIERYPDKFWGFGAVPTFLSYEETCGWIDKNIVAPGLLGAGEFTFRSGQTMLLENILKALTELKEMPVWIHTFHPLNSSDIKDLAELARRYDKIPFIFGHMGGVHWLDTIKLAKERGNIYLDLSAAFTTLAPALAVNELPGRTLFSSDAPYGNPLLMRRMVEMISPSKEVTDKVLGGNILRLLKAG